MKKFEPKLSFYEIEYYIENRFEEKQIKNTVVFNLVKGLTEKAYPSSKEKFEKRWECFYLPVKRRGKPISIPVFIMKYKRDFYVFFRFLGRLKISRGKEGIEKTYKEIFKECKRFIPVITSTNGNVIKRTVPYDFRIGRIKGKYIMDKLMPGKEKIKLQESYDRDLKRKLKINRISLNDYLNTAAVCYRAVYKGAKKLSPLEMYKKWADGRHAGMLDIKDRNSKKEFMEWSGSGGPVGGHPFEIVFSWHRHGIHLYPPYSKKPHYSLRVTNYAYAWDFIRMVEALIKNKTAFQAVELDDVLNFLTGEKYFTVNDYDELRFFYIPSREHKKLYFKHIDWEELKI